MSSIKYTDTEIIRDNIRVIGSELKKNKGILDKLAREIEWEPLYNILRDPSNEFITYRGLDLGVLIKCVVLRELFEMFDTSFQDEVDDRMSFQNFLDLKYADSIPPNDSLDSYRELLENSGYFFNLFSMISNQIAMKGIIDGLEITNFPTSSLSSDDLKDSDIEDMINEIENRVQSLYKTPADKSDSTSQEETPQDEYLSKKLNDIDSTLKHLQSNIKELRGSSELDDSQKLSDSISEKLKDVDDKIKELESEEISEQVKLETEKKNSEDLYKKLFDSFYTQLKEQNLLKDEVSKEDVILSSGEIDELAEKVSEKISEEKDTLPKHKPLDDDFVLEKRVEKTTGRERPVVMIPRRSEINLRDKKKFQIFNDSNLTEDYELGLRFYKLGYKTSFVNLKTDREHGSSRIATGEYFPNTFWGSVKQKSRWIAGIVFQGSKIYGWKGSLKTKYFLLRDRKAPITMVGTILAYLILIYFIIYFVSAALGNPIVPRIIPRNSPLNYLVTATLFFMCIRVFQRFAFTYNWYGLRYAIFSIPRMLVDNVVNLFATIRAVKVFRQTKEKVVWDSTEHY